MLLEFYRYSIYWLMLVLFIGFLALIYLNQRALFTKISKRTWLILTVIVIAGAVIRLFLFPHFHMMYIDEPWYMEMAKNMDQGKGPVVCEYVDLLHEECYMPMKPPAWPFFISIVFLFGLNNYHALYLSSIMGSLSVILIFMLTYLIFSKQKTALWSAFLLALTPVQVIWSNSAETNNASVFFVLLTMIFFFVYMNNKKKAMLLLTLSCLLLTILTRYENIVLVGIFVLGYLLFSRKFSRSYPGQVFWAFYPLIIAVILSTMIFFESFFFRIFRSSVLNVDFFYLNLFEFLRASSFNYIYVLLAAGCFFLPGKKDKSIAFLATCFIVFFVLYLPLFSEDRMALTPMLFIIILSSSVLDKICKTVKKKAYTVTLVLIFLILFSLGLGSAYDHIQGRYREHMLETQAVSELKDLIPEDCYVIAEWPVVFTSISDIKGISTSTALDNPEMVKRLINKSCVYYFYDGYCVDRTISRPGGSRERCREIMKIIKYNREKEFNSGGGKFSLNKITDLMGKPISVS